MHNVRGIKFPAQPSVFFLPTYSYLKQLKYFLLRIEAEKNLIQCRNEIVALRKELEILFEQEGNLQSPKVIEASQRLDQKIACYYVQQKRKEHLR